jgi:hypothetical protein
MRLRMDGVFGVLYYTGGYANIVDVRHTTTSAPSKMIDLIGVSLR